MTQLSDKLTKKDRENQFNIKESQQSESSTVQNLRIAKDNIHKMLDNYSEANDTKGIFAKKKFNKNGNDGWKKASKALDIAYNSTDDMLIRRHIDQLSENIKEYSADDVYETLDNLINVAQAMRDKNIHIQMKVQPTESLYNKADLLIFVDTQWTHHKPHKFYDEDGLTYYAYYKKDKNHYLIGSGTAKQIIHDPRFLFSERDKQMIKSRLDINGSSLNIKTLSLEEAKARFANKTNFY